MPLYRVYDIKYDVDDEGDDEGLPSELKIHMDIDQDISYDGADKISDVTGFCVVSFKYEEIK